MTLFAYTARTTDGSLVQAKVDGPSKASVAADLLRTGVTPVRIEELDANGGGAEISFRRQRVTQDDLIFFCRQMYRLVRSGVPLVRGMTGLAESTRNTAFRSVLEDLIEALRGGRELSEALRVHPKVFSPLFVSILHVGENTGNLDESFHQMGRYLDLDRENGRRIQAAMRYPMIVMGTVAAAMVVVNVWVIPAFAAAFKEFGAELPWATLFLIATSDFTVAYWPHLLGGLVALVLLARSFVGTQEGRLLWDRARLRIPVVGDVVYRGTLARFARSFSVTMSAGVPILKALDLVSGSLDNTHLSRQLTEMSQNVERGETLTRAAAACGIFDPLVLQMMAVGEETGTLNEMLAEIAETYESEVEFDLQRMSELVEPMLIVGVAGVVLVLALGVYLPMWNLAGAALR